MADPKPLYGTISYFGDSWTVFFKKTFNHKSHAYSVHTLSGYGDFPYDRFHGINIIDYRKDERVFDKLRMNLLVEEVTIITQFTTTFFSVVTLREFLKIHIALGISILTN